MGGELPDGNLASPSAVHCFTAATSSPSGYDTPATGPIEFALIAYPDGRVELSPAGD